MLNNSNQRQLKFDLNLNDRPMQKSMIQLNNQNSPRFSTTRSVPFDPSEQNQFKKNEASSQETLTAPGTTLTNSQASFTFNQVVHSYQPVLNRQNRKLNYLQMGTTSPALKGLLSPIKPQLRYEGNPEDFSKCFSKNQKIATSLTQPKFSNFQQEQLIQEIVTQVKERHLPQMLGKMKKQVYDDIYNLRLQFQAFRDEARIALKKNEGSLLEMKFLQNVMDNTSKGTVQKQNKTKSHDEFSELQTNYFLLEGKFSELQNRVSDHFKLNCQEFERLQTKFNNEFSKNTINISTIKSSLPPLLLEYKQMFCLKGEKTPHQIVFNSILYHIDKMGYLLDHENHYLLDKKGYQIKLEDRHFKLLQSYHLIHH